jgi:hypothetical protein
LVDPEGDVALGDSPRDNCATIVLPYQSPDDAFVVEKGTAPRRPASAMHRPVGPVTDEDANNSAPNSRTHEAPSNMPAPSPNTNNQPEYNNQGDTQPFNSAPNWDPKK